MNWFDSDYYHILYSNRDLKEAEHFIKILVNHLKIKKGSKILDLACGKGRHSIYLNKKGFDVTGYDNSEKSIEKAKKFKNNLLRFKRKEMTEEYEGSFDFIFNLFTSFGYISENHNINTLTIYILRNGSSKVNSKNSRQLCTIFNHPIRNECIVVTE